MGYRHIVVFRIHDHVSEETLDQALATLQDPGDLPGVLEWTVRRGDDERKGRIVVENALLDAPERMPELRSHPRHAHMAALMREVADWWVADYPEEERGTVR